MRMVRAAAAAVVVLIGLVVLQPAPASASDSLPTSAEQWKCAYVFGWDCQHAEDAALWAQEVAAWRFPDVGNQHNNMADAFRHCAWMGALATRLGRDGAYYVGWLHEENTLDNPPEEYAMDDMNNWRGAEVGEDARNMGLEDQWGYVMSECESLARSYSLFGLDGLMGSYI